MLKTKIGKPSQIRLVDENGTFRRVSDVVRQEKAICGIDAGFYSGKWGVHPKGSIACGQLVQNGQVIRWPRDMDPEGKGKADAHYHAIYKVNGQLRISHWIPESTPGNVVEWGLKMGPRLLEAGQVCLESINDPRWDIKTTACPRVGAGILANDDVVFAYDSGATLKKFAETLMGLGCVEAIGCDGGSSASYTDLETGDSYGHAMMPNALLMMPGRVTEEVDTPAPKQILKVVSVAKTKRPICIDPGHGRETDPGAIAWEKLTLEADINLDIALHFEKYLLQVGYAVALTHRDPRELRPGQGATAELQARCDVANIAKAALFVSIHVDSWTSATKRGTRCWHYPGSVAGKAVATVMADTLRPLAQIAGAAELMTGINDANFYVLHWTDMPAVLVECGFMSNVTDVALLREPGYRDKIALSMTLGVIRADEKGLF